MNTGQEHLEALHEIRTMMKKSTRFFSLSGLSGVFAGLYAIIGAYFADTIISDFISSGNFPEKVYTFLIIDGLVILILSISTGILFSYRKAKRNNEKLFDYTALRLLINLFAPLAVGGIFSIILIIKGIVVLIAPVMLLFYGIALFNASKYTLDDIRYLGISEIVLGLICACYSNHGLLFWTIGFGLFHILYGAYMWYKYDRAAQ